MTVKIALLGFGTVGRGTYQALTVNAGEIERRTGVRVEVKRILERSLSAINSGIAPKELFTQNIDDIIGDPEIAVVAEILGGFEPATGFMLRALKAGKHVVTPNKAVVAANYEKLHAAAEASGVCIKYEASVGGAIPVIEVINRSLVANKITKIEGIVNGTTNYILTKMDEEGLSYGQALKQAQALGFAEADPTADVEGIDAANKICILMAEAFGVYVAPSKIDRTGITGVTPADLAAAREKNCRIKLIAKAELTEQGAVASVKPTLVPEDNPLYSVRNEFNAIKLSCNMADDIFLQGRGAGSCPTGSAMAADIVALACIPKKKTFGL